MAELKTIEVPVAGMDCAECAQHVRGALCALPGVQTADVLLSTEKAIVRLDPSLVSMSLIRSAVEGAGYRVPEEVRDAPSASSQELTRRALSLFGLVAGVILLVVVAGEWLGLFEQLTARVPFAVGAAIVVVIAWPVFVNVARATMRRQVTSHTLMSIGVLAALVVGEWATAAVVAFFMRMGDYAESITTESARRAVKELTALAPQTARVARDGEEVELPIAAVRAGDVVVVRPGEKIPVDGEVISGAATVNQATITGEALPVEAVPGSQVYAATLAQFGSLRVRTTRAGPDTTFGRVVKMVEEAETHRGEVQRFADRFSGYYLPIVATIAALTFLLRRDPLATAAVLVVACSCSIALATPIAMLASIGAAAKRGLLVKGGKYLETLARADVVFIDKTGTLTLGQPRITDVVSLDGLSTADVLALAAAVEQDSEHPLAAAVRVAAVEQGLAVTRGTRFEAIPGVGVRAVVGGREVAVGSRRLIAGELPQGADALQEQGKTLLYVARDGAAVGLLAASDTLRPDVAAALAALRELGIGRIELLTGDNARAAAALASSLGIEFRADLLPEDKIRAVREAQAAGRVVVMIGDGVNDAPALAQADVGIAMGAAGADIALEAAHLALLRDDWALIPEAFRIARRTMRVVKGNLLFTALYNVAGLSLAALGFLPPMLAAAAQSIPDLGILANSARLLRQKTNIR